MTPDAAGIPQTAAAAPPPAPDPEPHPGIPDEAQKRAIARAVWTDLLWLMPSDRTVTVIVRDGRVAVELGPPDPISGAAAA